MTPLPKATLVFLHEGLGAAAAWKDFPGAVAAATGLAAFAYDRAGYGGTSVPRLPLPVEFMHHEALVALPAVLDEAGIDRAILVGHSDGASIALIAAAASTCRSRIEALVLEAPHVFVEEKCLEAIRCLRTRYPGELRDGLQKYHGAEVDRLFTGWTEVWMSPAFRDWNIEGYLPSVTVPILAIQGRDDPFGTLEQVRRIAALAAGPVELEVLDGGGHAPHRDAFDSVVQRIARFVAAL